MLKSQRHVYVYPVLELLGFVSIYIMLIFKSLYLFMNTLRICFLLCYIQLLRINRKMLFHEGGHLSLQLNHKRVCSNTHVFALGHLERQFVAHPGNISYPVVQAICFC